MFKINAHWYVSHNSEHVTNWGDAINPWLIKKMSGLDAVRGGNSRLFAAGSILQHGVKDGDIIWGTGTLADNLIERNLKLDIRAVRGPLTRSVLINSGYDCPDIYGDPALLVKDYYNPEVERTHQVGIIPHITERDNPVVLDLIKRYGIKLIDIGLGHTEFIDSLKSVELVLSSSLHGLIMADAYGISNTKVDIPGPQYKGSNWKYADYFASVRRPMIFGEMLYEGVDLVKVINSSHFNKGIDLDLNPLRNSFPYPNN
jgi:pyruvyltransferase